MKKILSILLIAALALLCFGCSDDSSSDISRKAESITVHWPDQPVAVGEYVEIDIEIDPATVDASDLDCDIEGGNFTIIKEYSYVRIRFEEEGKYQVTFSSGSTKSDIGEITVVPASELPDADDESPSSSSSSGASATVPSPYGNPTSSSNSSGNGGTASSESSGGSSGSNFTTSQRNAIDRAKSYLSIMYFSRQGLIEQLEYEGFSTSDATFAVDHISVDWNSQALGKAQDYLETMPFSYSGI